jgi:hypothetical protein
MRTEEPARIVFRRLIERIDLQRIDRTQWRAVCRGAERLAMQAFLLQLASAARAGTEADRLALLKAAHAVLPLHGTALNELAELLIREPTPAIDYADALVEALAQQPTGGSPLVIGILAALRRCCACGAFPARIEWIESHVAALGYTLDSR